MTERTGGGSAWQEIMANAADTLEVQSRGDLSFANVTNLLRTLEKSRSTARICLETEIGVGQIAFHEGQLVLAEVGPLRRRAALMRILDMSEGSYTLDRGPVPPGPAVVPDVETAVRMLTNRQEEWRSLCGQCPPMGSVLRLSSAGRAAKRESTGAERIVYLLVDGRRTLMDILAESELDPIEALKAVMRGIRSGYFEDTSHTPSLLPLPTEEISGEITKIPSAPMVPRFEASRREVRSRNPSDWGGMRKGTLVGLGVDLTSSTPPPQPAYRRDIETSPIIELGGAPSERGCTLTTSVELVDVATGTGVSGASKSTVAHTRPNSAAVASDAADSLVANPKPILDNRSPTNSAPNNNIRYVGRYEVLHRIGRGGMGSVYLARLTTQGGFRRLFALKLLRSHLARDGAATEAFLAEARLAGQLHHPNVVSVIDAGVHNEQPYLVMDYVEGCSLKQLMVAQPGFRPPQLIIPIILSALDGLHAVHSLRGEDGAALNIVHCDVSPENLLVGVDGICRLTDLGVALRAQLGGAQSIHGKPGYVAPEQITGGAIDCRADIFSIGVVLWAALTGERLFHGSTVEETLQRVCGQHIAPPSTVGLLPPTALDAICLKALERNPDDRFATAEEMQADLREVAIREGLIGLNSEVATWVRKTTGPELSQRRLLVLEASRPRDASDVDPENGSTVGEDAAGFEPPPSTVRLNPSPEDGDSRTIRLAIEQKTHRIKQIALIVAAALAGAMILAAIVWPSVLTRLFKMETQPRDSLAPKAGFGIKISDAPAAKPSNAPVTSAAAPIVTPVTTPKATRPTAQSPVRQEY